MPNAPKTNPATHSTGQPNGASTHGTTIDYLPALFLVAVLFFLPIDSEAETRNSLVIVFISIVLEAIPFMLFGSLVGGFIEAYVSRERMAALLPKKGWLTVCVAAGAGIVFPVCECAVVPVVRRLIGKGLPLSAAIAYLLGGPIVNPIVATSTALAYAFDWRIVMLRSTLGYGIAIVIGLIMGRLFSRATAIRENSQAAVGHHHHSGCEDSLADPEQPHGGCAHHIFTSMPDQTQSASAGSEHPQTAKSLTFVDKAGWAFSHAMDDFLAVGHYLVIGAFIAALAQTYVERSSFLALSEIPLLSIVLMMALAILLNLCSEADAFIAASFQDLVSIPAQIAFMVTGPMFDLKLLLMYQSIFTRKAIVALASLVLVVVLAIAFGLEMLNGMLP